jgi:hypothetical protein
MLHVGATGIDGWMDNIMDGFYEVVLCVCLSGTNMFKSISVYYNLNSVTMLLSTGQVRVTGRAILRFA